MCDELISFFENEGFVCDDKAREILMRKYAESKKFFDNKKKQYIYVITILNPYFYYSRSFGNGKKIGKYLVRKKDISNMLKEIEFNDKIQVDYKDMIYFRLIKIVSNKNVDISKVYDLVLSKIDLNKYPIFLKDLYEEIENIVLKVVNDDNI